MMYRDQVLDYGGEVLEAGVGQLHQHLVCRHTRLLDAAPVTMTTNNHTAHTAHRDKTQASETHGEISFGGGRRNHTHKKFPYSWQSSTLMSRITII